MKIYIIGPYPPPLGGISVFVYRKAKLLKRSGENVITVDFPNLSKLEKIIILSQFIFNPKPATFHINIPSIFVMASLILRPFSSHIIYQDHSGRGIPLLPWFKRKIIGLFLKEVDECIFVGEHLKEYYGAAKIPLPENILIQNAFLPPPLEDEGEIWNTYDPSTHSFINNHNPLIIANAYKIAFHEGIDLYGIDLCIELIARIKSKHNRVGLLFALAEIGDEAYFRKIHELIHEYNIEQHIHFMTGQKELWPIFKVARIMVRPTVVDAYGVSIAEALFFGCPAVASDVCKRPPGTLIFRNRDLSDMMDKVNKVLDGTSG
jgi:glycosyltransferase involved in cell wall biosynthesis